MTRGEIVEPRGLDELAAQPGDGRGLRVVEHQIEREQIGRRRLRELARAQLLGDELRESRRALEPRDRHQLRLRVELQALALDLAIQMDREARDAQQRAREIDEQRARASLLAQRHLPREREIPVEPGVGQHAPVRLDRELAVAVGVDVGERLEAQVRRIGVGADDAEAALHRRDGAHVQGHETAAAAHAVAPLAGRELPGVDLVRLAVAGRLEPADALGDRVIRGGRAIDEAEQIRDRVLHRQSP